MTISAISTASSNPYYSQQNSAKQDFGQLVSALQSGNLSAAQSAFASFSQSAGSQLDPNSPFTQAINQIGQDLQSGNISAAQQTLSSLQQSSGAHHAHGHHHHGGGAPPTDSSSTSTTDDPTSLAAALTLSSTNTVDVSA
jgi:hypothetical protein